MAPDEHARAAIESYIDHLQDEAYVRNLVGVAGAAQANAWGERVAVGLPLDERLQMLSWLRNERFHSRHKFGQRAPARDDG